MSSISFPSGSTYVHDPSSSLPASPGSTSVLGGSSIGGGGAAHISFFPASYDPHAASSSFQVNPLSSHPPRTPRTSIVAGSTTAADMAGDGIALAYAAASAHDELAPQAASDDGEGDDERLDDGKRVRKEEVWREILATSTGRDKALKLIQYSMRVYLSFHDATRGSLRHSSLEEQLLLRMRSTMAGLSLARKCLILFNWLTPLNTITAPQPLPYASSSKLSESSQARKKPPPSPPFLHKFLHAPPPVLLDLLNSIADDVATFSRLGLIGKRAGERAGNLADWCWFSSTLVGLVEVGVEQGLVKNLMEEVESRLYESTLVDGTPAPGRSAMNAADEKELEKLRRQNYWLNVSRAKLLMDLIFVSYECFKLKRARGPAMGISGLLSAILSSMKLYDRHHTALVKSLSH